MKRYRSIQLVNCQTRTLTNVALCRAATSNGTGVPVTIRLLAIAPYLKGSKLPVSKTMVRNFNQHHWNQD
ncbi:uncharacterized protein BDZ99DRAFT_306459 [Mytilinidion resinicola]|uniref:Uncharacterized protein n=1 Tax=Mytilinidion resinicola TaxID=574789 RepID=A0A6A6YQA5_9PEZI|nr:uncharacterized protein BDZ99DRAFT_306459 [Mytilinidion resinicola]KAF2810175.1 hypothetical protein BDZ99DRAFT_306459 [Mytilinidion resinicola]